MGTQLSLKILQLIDIVLFGIALYLFIILILNQKK